ncbi:conserved hypothetical protein [Alteromonas sp. 38]|nr:conserved hypothetical protein [Alteromonas sp. 154]VXB05771.1 conserved hypothetical protein [Alteromonas sp. 38]
MSIALSSHATGKKIYAKGTGGRDVYGSVESWSWGAVK